MQFECYLNWCWAADHLSYLHLKHEPLSWSQSMYGYFRGVSNGIRALTIFLLVPLLRKKLPLQDPQLMMLAFATYAISRTVFGLSTKTWLVFMGNLTSNYSQCTLSTKIA